MPVAATRFPNLDGLRFIGAALVIIWHTEKTRQLLGLGRAASLPHWELLGGLGVRLFFVLSGFLITWLLLDEERRLGRIHVRPFLMRRMLRIWPLYFLMVLLTLFVIPLFPLLHIPGMSPAEVLSEWPRKLLLFALFLPTLVPDITNGVPDAAHLWSIGTEEYFYALWPLALIAFKRIRLLLIIGVFFGWSAIYVLLANGPASGTRTVELLFAFWRNFNIDAMAAGAGMAMLLLRQGRVLRILLDGRVFIATAVITVAVLSRYEWIAAAGTKVIEVLFALLVLNLAANPRAARLLEQPLLRYLGRISYGLYVYHPPLVVLVLSLLARFHVLRDVWAYPAVFLLTIAVAGGSYRFFEAPVLKLRNRYRPAAKPR